MNENKKHIQKTGTRAGQWVTCTAKVCRNGGTHTTSTDLYGAAGYWLRKTGKDYTGSTSKVPSKVIREYLSMKKTAQAELGITEPIQKDAFNKWQEGQNKRIEETRVKAKGYGLTLSKEWNYSANINPNSIDSFTCGDCRTVNAHTPIVNIKADDLKTIDNEKLVGSACIKCKQTNIFLTIGSGRNLLQSNRI